MTPQGGSRREYIQREFNDHPSLASLNDFEPSLAPSRTFEISSQHSGFQASSRGTALSDFSDSDSTGPWSPPAWRKPPSGWFNPIDRLAAVQHSSRESSPKYEEEEDDEEEDTTIPANVPLPQSPEKRTPSVAPEPQVKEEKYEPEPEGDNAQVYSGLAEQDAKSAVDFPQNDNYFRFTMRAEVQQRTEPIQAFVSSFNYQYQRITKSKRSIMSFIIPSIISLVIFRRLTQPYEPGPGPDLLKVAGLARSFEPIILYSEHGSQQIGELQETSVAVWDLGESIRYSNMTSAPIIVNQLDVLSESFKTLAFSLHSFFANVNGDIDSILQVMDWAKLELAQVSGHQPTPIDSFHNNVHAYARRIGGEHLSSTLTSVFGVPPAEKTETTLQRTFNVFLNVLEESINTELTYTTTLFGQFESIDRQFLNLQRTVIRETDTQDHLESSSNSELAELWRRRIGSNAARIAKYEKNKHLLSSIKDKTVQNKLTLVEHNGKLLRLKSTLEVIRKRLVSPLVRANETSTLSVEEQVRGIEGTHELLWLARQQQKGREKARLERDGGGRRGVAIMIGDDEA